MEDKSEVIMQTGIKSNFFFFKFPTVHSRKKKMKGKNEGSKEISIQEYNWTTE